MRIDDAFIQPHAPFECPPHLVRGEGDGDLGEFGYYLDDIARLPHQPLPALVLLSTSMMHLQLTMRRMMTRSGNM
eukprot:3041998-Amphidinium_carterae.1